MAFFSIRKVPPVCLRRPIHWLADFQRFGPPVVEDLQSTSHNATHIRDDHMQRADPEVFARCESEMASMAFSNHEA